MPIFQSFFSDNDTDVSQANRSTILNFEGMVKNGHDSKVDMKNKKKHKKIKK